jgi:diphthine synthase
MIMTLSLISIGLTDEKDMSLKAVEEAKGCTKLYVELYTMKLSSTAQSLSELLGRGVTLLRRGDLEESAGKILEEAEESNVGVFVGGDCLSATTHISLVIEAAKKGVDVRIIHGSSIFTAINECGLSLYKFGRTVTMPLPEKGSADSVIKAIEDNASIGLHTLILLDLDIENQKFMTITSSLERLKEAGFSAESLIIGLSRLGSSSSMILAGKLEDIARIDFGEPPQCLIIPGQLHFLEAEALKTLAKCPDEVLSKRVIKTELDRLIEKYSSGCRKVLNNMELKPPKQPTANQVNELLDHVNRYLDDAEYYAVEKKPTSLTSVAYAEGILDALKLLGLAEFEW